MALDKAKRIIIIPFLIVVFILGLVHVLAPKYYSAVIPAPGFSMEVLTAPTNPLASALLRMHARLELGSPCNYELLGWSKTSELYYSESCYGNKKFWVYGSSGRPVITHDVPNSLKYNTVNALTYVRVRDWRNPTAGIPLITKSNGTSEGTYRAMILRGHKQIVSQDGNLIALISTHIYGPEEVVVVRIK